MSIGRSFVALVGLASWFVVGCGPSGPKTYTVQGKVNLAGGEVQKLAGNHVEAALASDPTVRVSGEIRDDGSFSLETLRSGAVLKGAPEGRYQVRVVLADEGASDQRKRRG